jgi:predicted CopG family antitoxin
MTLTRLKHIVIDEDNYATLKELGKAGDSFNDVLTEILAKTKMLPEAGPKVGAHEQPPADLNAIGEDSDERS